MSRHTRPHRSISIEIIVENATERRLENSGN